MKTYPNGVPVSMVSEAEHLQTELTALLIQLQHALLDLVKFVVRVKRDDK